MIERGGQECGAATLADERAAHAAAEVIAVGGSDVGQVHPLAVVPQLLGGVEFRRVGRQPFDHHAGSALGSVGEPALHRGLVHVELVLHDDQRPLDRGPRRVRGWEQPLRVLRGRFDQLL